MTATEFTKLNRPWSTAKMKVYTFAVNILLAAIIDCGRLLNKFNIIENYQSNLSLSQSQAITNKYSCQSHGPIHHSKETIEELHEEFSVLRIQRKNLNSAANEDFIRFQKIVNFELEEYRAQFKQKITWLKSCIDELDLTITALCNEIAYWNEKMSFR